MASGSRNTLFGMTLTELVIILFFIMLLLALDTIDDLNEQIPDSSEDVVAASSIFELLIPDGEINSDLVPFDVIKDEIAKLKKDNEELKDFKEAAQGTGDGDCTEGGNWINSKCADYCWAVDAEGNKRPYDVLLDIGMCQSTIVVQRSQWLRNSESNFVQVPGALEAVQQNIMSKDELYAYLDEVKKPGYERTPKQCFHVVRFVELEQIYADPWTKSMQEVQESVSTELYTLRKPGYSKVREQFPEDICNVVNESQQAPIKNVGNDVPEIKSFQEPLPIKQNQAINESVFRATIVKSDLDILSFQTKAEKECKASNRFRNSEITLEFAIQINPTGKAISVNLTSNNPSLSSNNSRLSRLAIKALNKSSYSPETVEGVPVNSLHTKKLKFPENFCSF